MSHFYCSQFFYFHQKVCTLTRVYFNDGKPFAMKTSLQARRIYLWSTCSSKFTEPRKKIQLVAKNWSVSVDGVELFPRNR